MKPTAKDYRDAARYCLDWAKWCENHAINPNEAKPYYLAARACRLAAKQLSATKRKTK